MIGLSATSGMEPTMPVPPSTVDLVRRVDALVLAIHQHPVEQRRRIVNGVVRRLIRNSGVHRLDVVLVVQSSRDKAEASLEHMFARVLDVVRTGLADPGLEDRVVEIVVHRIAEIATDLDGRNRNRLDEAIRWSGW